MAPDAPPQVEVFPELPSFDRWNMALPRIDFLQGYPGIAASDTRPDAHLTGTIDVQLGSKGLECEWLRVEMAKTETLPTGETWTELIGQGPIDVWSAKGGWDLLHSRTFPFCIEIPAKLPPTLILDKRSGIRYELIATLSVRVKRGLLKRKVLETVLRDARSIVIEKHELHSTWPIYNVPEEHEAAEGPFQVKLFRNKEAYAPLDTVEVRIVTSNGSPNQEKLKSVTLGVRQTVTYFPGNRGGPEAVTQKNAMLVSKNKNFRKKLKSGEFFMADLSVLIPKKPTIMSIHTAKHIEVSHSLRVVVVIGNNKISFEHVDLQISGFYSNVSAATTARIGTVPELCDVNGPRTDRPAAERHNIFLSEGDDLMNESALPDTFESNNGSVAPVQSGYAAIYENQGMQMPDLDANDADVLGTPTPRGPVRNQFMNQPPEAESMLAPRTSLSGPPGGGVPPQSSVDASPVMQGSSSLEAIAVPMRRPQPSGTASTPLNARNGPGPASSSAAAHSQGFVSAEQEKVRLFERARAEAEQFQAQMPDGVQFPEAELANSTATAAPVSSAAYGKASTPHAAFPSAAEEKANLYQRAREEVIAYHGGEPEAAVAPGPAAQRPADTEKDQMRRYYEAQDAVARHRAEQEAVASGTMSTNASAPQVPSVSTNMDTPLPSGSVSETSPYLTQSEARAVHEKSQLQSHFDAHDQRANPSPPAFESNSASGSKTPARPPKVPLS